MKAKLNTSAFKSALTRLSSIPGAVASMIHTQAIKVEASMEGLQLSRFTNEAKITLTISDGVEIEDTTGEPQVAYAGLLNLVGICGTQEIEMSSEGGYVYLKGGKRESKLKSFSPDDIAEAPSFETKMPEIRLPSADLAAMLDFALAAVAKDNSNGDAFTGIGIRMIGDKLTFIATDKRCCHVAQVEQELPVNVIVSAEAVQSILKALAGENGECTLGANESIVSVTTDNASMHFALLNVEGGFPNSPQFYLDQPGEVSCEFTLNKSEFVEELKACSAISESESRWVDVDVRKKNLVLRSSNNRDSATTAEIGCKGTGVSTFAVNSSQLARALSGFKGEDGNVKITQYPTAIFLRSPTRTAFFGLAKPQYSK